MTESKFKALQIPMESVSPAMPPMLILPTARRLSMFALTTPLFKKSRVSTKREPALPSIPAIPPTLAYALSTPFSYKTLTHTRPSFWRFSRLPTAEPTMPPAYDVPTEASKSMRPRLTQLTIPAPLMVPPKKPTMPPI